MTYRHIKLTERIMQPLYDRVWISNNEKEYKFFQIPEGSFDSVMGKNKNITHTNLETEGYLSFPKRFELHAFRLFLSYDADLKDINEIKNNSWLRFYIGKKDYLVVRTYMLIPEPTDNEGNRIVSVCSGRPDTRGTYILAEPLDIVSDQNFYGELVFEETPKLSKPVMAALYLDGYIKKECNCFQTCNL